MPSPPAADPLAGLEEGVGEKEGPSPGMADDDQAWLWRDLAITHPSPGHSSTLPSSGPEFSVLHQSQAPRPSELAGARVPPEPPTAPTAPLGLETITAHPESSYFLPSTPRLCCPLRPQTDPALFPCTFGEGFHAWTGLSSPSLGSWRSPISHQLINQLTDQTRLQAQLDHWTQVKAPKTPSWSRDLLLTP